MTTGPVLLLGAPIVLGLTLVFAGIWVGNANATTERNGS